MTVGIMATYLVALDAYAGAFIQDRIVGGDTWRDRNKCRVWDGSFFEYETYRDDDDEMKECAKYSIRKARTVAFIALVWAENLRAYTARSFTRPIWVNICVEINQCAVAPAPSSGEEPAPPRHRAGVASMAWRSTRRFPHRF